MNTEIRVLGNKKINGATLLFKNGDVLMTSRDFALQTSNELNIIPNVEASVLVADKGLGAGTYSEVGKTNRYSKNKYWRFEFLNTTFDTKRSKVGRPLLFRFTKRIQP